MWTKYFSNFKKTERGIKPIQWAVFQWEKILLNECNDINGLPNWQIIHNNSMVYVHWKQKVMEITEDLKLTDISNTCWQQKLLASKRINRRKYRTTPANISALTNYYFWHNGRQKNSQRFTHLQGQINLLCIIWYLLCIVHYLYFMIIYYLLIKQICKVNQKSALIITVLWSLISRIKNKNSEHAETMNI